MNRLKKEYLQAKTNLDILKEQENEIDRLYIVENGIKNPDGSIPKNTFMIEDYQVAEKAIEEVSDILEETGLWAKIIEAQDQLKKAEDNLIQYAIKIIPRNFIAEKETLTEAAEKNTIVRRKIIELALQLETKF